MKTSLSFKANFVQNSNILRVNRFGQGENCSVSLVELSPSNKDDLSAVKMVNRLWGEHKTIAQEINDHMDSSRYDNSNTRFFALTTQRNNFENPEANKILGLAEVLIKSKEQVQLKFLQVDPKSNCTAKHRMFKGVGRAIVKGLKKMYSDCEMIIVSLESAAKFYKKCGATVLRKTIFKL